VRLRTKLGTFDQQFKNSYESREDYSILRISKANEPALEVLVDATDVPELSKLIWAPQGTRNPEITAYRDSKQVFLRKILFPEARTVVSLGDRFDYRRKSLRAATKREVLQLRKKRTGCHSKYKGVTFSKIKMLWLARIMFAGNYVFLGYHADEEKAARRYDAAAKEYFGEFARLNFADVQTIAA